MFTLARGCLDNLLFFAACPSLFSTWYRRAFNAAENHYFSYARASRAAKIYYIMYSFAAETWLARVCFFHQGRVPSGACAHQLRMIAKSMGKNKTSVARIWFGARLSGAPFAALYFQVSRMIRHRLLFCVHEGINCGAE